jgi:hypothetical protein
MQASAGNPIRWYILLVFVIVILAFPIRDSLQAKPAAQESKDRPFVVEYYYKAKWGHADEFIALFKKNHYPLLKKEMELGRILKVFATAPRYHTTEDGRWDYRTTIIFKNAEVAHDAFDSAPLLKQLFPDQDTYKREEQHRFEILDAHWDVPINDVDLGAK